MDDLVGIEPRSLAPDATSCGSAPAKSSWNPNFSPKKGKHHVPNPNKGSQNSRDPKPKPKPEQNAWPKQELRNGGRGKGGLGRRMPIIGRRGGPPLPALAAARESVEGAVGLGDLQRPGIGMICRSPETNLDGRMKAN